MERRRFVAAAAVGGTAGLAGCSSILGDETGAVPERNPAHEVTDNVTTAVGLANTAALSLEAVDTQFDDPAAIEFDETEPRDRLDEAGTALDDAEAADDGSQAEDIAAAREYVGIVESMVDMFVALLGGAEQLADSDEAFDTAEIDRLESSVSAAREPIERALTARDAGVESRDSVDDDRLIALDAEFETVAEGFAELVSFTDGFDALTAGYGTLLDGVQHVDTAQSLFDSEEYEGARGSFADATTAFESAGSTFADGSSDAHQELDTEFQRAIDRSDSLTRLSSSHESMLEGREPLIEGRDQFEDGNFDAASDAFAAAADSFASASEELTDDSRPAGEFDTQFEQARCRAENLQTSAEEFDAAAAAGAEGNLREADDRFDAGQAALDAVANC